MNTLTVGELNTQIKSVLSDAPELNDVWVKGEVSNATQAHSGHWYWTIKDDEASMDCVMWKGVASRQVALPENGSEFTFHGNISFYPKSGRVQLYVDLLEQEGIGDLHRRFEALKAVLEAEGLFDQDRKRPIPLYPRRLGIVTSLDAAALRDVCHVLERRWPSVEVFVAPTRVQGAEAPAEIVAALESIARADVDAVIVTRGGGSIEDLWAFNEEIVARAIAACPVPTIAGVGHETDTTIADYVADMRAPTPSAAAELVTPDGRELRLAVDEARDRLSRETERQLRSAQDGTASSLRRLRLASPSKPIAAARETIEARRSRMQRALESSLSVSKARLDGRIRRLGALNPHAILERGYAHVTNTTTDAPVRSTADIKAGDGLRIAVADGDIDAVVRGQGRLFE